MRDAHGNICRPSRRPNLRVEVVEVEAEAQGFVEVVEATVVIEAEVVEVEAVEVEDVEDVEDVEAEAVEVEDVEAEVEAVEVEAGGTGVNFQAEIRANVNFPLAGQTWAHPGKLKAARRVVEVQTDGLTLADLGGRERTIKMETWLKWAKTNRPELV